MFETSEETQETSPLQTMLHGAYLIYKLHKELEKSNNKEDVEDAATGEK